MSKFSEVVRLIADRYVSGSIPGMSSILDSRISSDGRPLNWTTHNFKAVRRARNGKTGWDILWMQNRSASHQKFVILLVISLVASIVWVHSSVVRAADRRSAGPWLKSGCALVEACLPFEGRRRCSRTEKAENSVRPAPASKTSLAIRTWLCPQH